MKITPVTSQYLTTQSFNSGKSFVGSTVGTSIFKYKAKDSKPYAPNIYENPYHKLNDQRFEEPKIKSDTLSTNSFSTINTVNPLTINKMTEIESIGTSTIVPRIEDAYSESHEVPFNRTSYLSTENPELFLNADEQYTTHMTTKIIQETTETYTQSNDFTKYKYDEYQYPERYIQPPYNSDIRESTSSSPIPTSSIFPAVPPRPFQLASTQSTISEFSKNEKISEDFLMPYPFFKISTASPFSLSQSTIQDNNIENRFDDSARGVHKNMSNMIDALFNANIFETNDNKEALRPGLVVPSSVSPQTLRSLATYFENTLGDNSTAEDFMDKELVDDAVNIMIEEKLKTLLTNMTRLEYENLFKKETMKENNETLNSLVPIPDITELYPSENTYKVRELAKLFAKGLSEYLDDPTNFKKVLLKIRPTEPPHTNISNFDTEILNFSEDDLKSSLISIYNKTNWGFTSIYKNDSNINEKSNSLNSESESLSSADSQSFISQFNNLNDEEKQKTFQYNNLPNNHWTSSNHVTNLWRTTFAVNPYSLNQNFQATESYKEYNSEPEFSDDFSDSEVSSTHTPQTEIKYELRAFPKLSLNSSQLHGIFIDFMNVSTHSESNRFQRILKKLNTTEDEFLNKMKQIEENPLTRRLILLLIHECDLKNREDEIFKTEPTENLKRQIHDSNSDSGESVHSEKNEHEDYSSSIQDQDTRALHLLNSLYSIATKFGR
ncbi:hypothetical protein HHI36_013572 [Cryptolaemus montrouzieri]|uniref:Uncharacterized protein n=1 Tax=Cryptolaemus montrouzieri TaxID=559131 RepID=A0ABD2NI86_9CUCU